MTDPIFNPAGAGNPQAQTDDTHQDIFGGSNDIFNNTNMFQPVEPVATPAQAREQEDFHLDFDQLQVNQNRDEEQRIKNEEPEIIEPQAQETFEEYQARQNPPQPKIIEQVVEPQMKPEVKVNPRRQGTTNNEQLKVSRPQVQAPAKPVAPRPQVQAPAKPVQAPFQAKPQVQIPSRPVAPVVLKPQPKPQVQAPAKPVQAPVQVVRPPEIKIEATPQATTSDLQKKLAELISTAKNIYALEKKQEDEVVELLGANNDKVTILYQITLPDNGILIKKIETDIDTQEEMINDLGFTIENNSVQVLLDDMLLFDEVEHLQDDPKKKMQVTEKMNKFIFLLSEHQKKIEKEAKEQKEAEQERRRLQDIFRNF